MRVRVGYLDKGRRESSGFVSRSYFLLFKEMGENAVYWCLGRERDHLRGDSGWEANEIPTVSILYDFICGALLHVCVLRLLFWKR